MAPECHGDGSIHANGYDHKPSYTSALEECPAALLETEIRATLLQYCKYFESRGTERIPGHSGKGGNMKGIEFIKNMETLEIKENDILVIRVNYPIAAEVAIAIKESVLQALPKDIKDKVGVLVFDSAADIGIVRTEYDKSVKSSDN